MAGYLIRLLEIGAFNIPDWEVWRFQENLYTCEIYNRIDVRGLTGLSLLSAMVQLQWENEGYMQHYSSYIFLGRRNLFSIRWRPKTNQPGNGLLTYEYDGYFCPKYQHLANELLCHKNMRSNLFQRFINFLKRPLFPEMYSIDEMQFFLLLLFEIVRRVDNEFYPLTRFAVILGMTRGMKMNGSNCCMDFTPLFYGDARYIDPFKVYHDQLLRQLQQLNI